jgi:hypothetical protein
MGDWLEWTNAQSHGIGHRKGSSGLATALVGYPKTRFRNFRMAGSDNELVFHEGGLQAAALVLE